MRKFPYSQQEQVQVHGSVSTTVSLLSSHTTYNRDHPLEQVMSFKYLGVHLSCDLSWSMHIETMHHIQSQESGRSFVSTVLQFFTTCCSSLPLPITCETTLRICFSCMESLEERFFNWRMCRYFGLCMATKLWAYPYDYVLYRSQLNSLEIRRTITGLCNLFILPHQFGLCRMYCESEIKP